MGQVGRHGLLEWANGLGARAFPEREFFVRTDGNVRFAAVSRRRQMGIAALVVLAVAWTAFVTVVYFSYDARLAASNAKITETRAAYERVVAERDAAAKKSIQAYRDLLASTTPTVINPSPANLDSLYELVALRTRTALLGEQVAHLQGELKGVRGERDRIAADDAALMRQRDALDGQLAELKHTRDGLNDTVADLKNQLKGADARYATLGHDRDNLAVQLKGVQADVGTMRSKNDTTAAQLAALETNLATVAAARDKLNVERGELDLQVGQLEQHLASLQADQKALVTRLSERAASGSGEAERTIAMTGLNVDRLLAEVARFDSDNAAAKPAKAGVPAKDAKDIKETREAKEARVTRDLKTGKGGPFVAFPFAKGPAAAKPTPHSSEVERVVSALDSQEERREGLRKILTRLPLAAPIDNYRVVSEFGPRMDPFNGRYAMHQGVDLASHPGAAVMATAPGVVVFAGWDGSYGKMVEIDHGMGIHTRYAHMRTIMVEVGRKVATRTQLGVIGSTGRSTGTHVHYEVLVDDRPNNPVKFMRAGEYVFSKN